MVTDEQDLKQRDLRLEERTALKKYLFIDQNRNLAVVILDTLARKGAYIVEVPEDEVWLEDGNDNGWGNIIVCQMLWLARLDAKFAAMTGDDKLLKNDIDPKNIVYDEFKHPDKIYVIGNADAFVQNHTTQLRNQETGRADYRDHSDRLSRLLIAKAIADLGIRYETIITKTGVKTLAPRLDEEVVIIEIPRASKPMSNAAMDLLPKSAVGIVFLQRDENDPKSRPNRYFSKLPKIDKKSVVVIVDPMLATGGSMCDAIDEVVKHNPKGIKVVCQIAAPEGIRRLQVKYPDVEIWVGELDSHLNGTNYIIPGLGDAGDRYYGT